MRVRAYPVEAAPPASDDAIRIQKRWHTFDLDWPARGQTPVQSHSSR